MLVPHSYPAGHASAVALYAMLGNVWHLVHDVGVGITCTSGQAVQAVQLIISLYENTAKICEILSLMW